MQQNKESLLLFIVISTIFFLMIGIFCMLIIYLFYQNKRKNKLEKNEMKYQFEQTMLQAQLEIQENTFNYISGEIHDNIGQILSLTRINVNILAESTPSEILSKIDSLLGKAIKDLRDLSHNLNSSHLLDIGIIEALNQLLQQIEKTGKYTTQLTADPSIVGFFDYDSCLILYRIIQELLNNIIKHACASQIIVSIKMIDPTLCLLTVADNGKGFDHSVVLKEKKGIGLRHIFSRAKMINATITMQSNEPKGCIFFIEIKK